MALFVVPVKAIDRVWPHPNADRLELASVQGISWQFVVAKGEYQPGDRVVYFPIDSLLPDALVELLGIRAFLAGPKQDRVKTAKLRGEISQGLVASLSKVVKLVEQTDFAPATDTDLKDLLGVTKYEPAPVFGDAQALTAMPGHVSTFDVESVDNFPHIAALLMEQPVVVTEKLEGTNWWCTANAEGELSVGQRNFAVMELEGKPENLYWKCARDSGLLEFCSAYAREHQCLFTLRGELLGPKIQANYYELSEPCVYLFAAEVNGNFVPSQEFFAMLPDTARVVPQLTPPGGLTLRTWLAGRTVREASDGKSILCPKKNREGIVVVPAMEQRNLETGRLMLKQRSPLYLSKTDF
jgi:RNA ligase (TIGR02306 family)